MSSAKNGCTVLKMIELPSHRVVWQSTSRSQFSPTCHLFLPIVHPAMCPSGHDPFLSWPICAVTINFWIPQSDYSVTDSSRKRNRLLYGMRSRRAKVDLDCPTVPAEGVTNFMEMYCVFSISRPYFKLSTFLQTWSFYCFLALLLRKHYGAAGLFYGAKIEHSLGGTAADVPWTIHPYGEESFLRSLEQSF